MYYHRGYRKGLLDDVMSELRSESVEDGLRWFVESPAYGVEPSRDMEMSRLQATWQDPEGGLGG